MRPAPLGMDNEGGGRAVPGGEFDGLFDHVTPTPKEFKCAKDDTRWRVLVITNALTAPSAALFKGRELLERAKIEATQYRVMV